MNREDLISYLLRRMPEEERAALEDRWISDEGLHEQLRDTEAQLLDAYIRGELPADERVQIEKYLLVSDVQKRKLEFARALQAAVPVPRRALGSWAMWVAIAACLVLATATIWIGWQNRLLRQEMANLRVESPKPHGAVYSALLRPDATRGAAKPDVIRLPRGTDFVRLELVLDPGDEGQSYTVQVSSTDKNIIGVDFRPEARGSRFVLAIEIPAANLKPGNYQVTLNPAKPVNFYYFRIAEEISAPPAP